MTAADKQHEIVEVAESLFAAKPDWVTFYREILGLGGIVRRKYRSLRALSKFEQTDAYRQVQQMLTQLRKLRRTPKEEESQKAEEGPEIQEVQEVQEEEPTRVITVRIPKSLHDALRLEAFEHRTSLNKLCISKLLQFIDNEMVPAASLGESDDVRADDREKKPGVGL